MEMIAIRNMSDAEASEVACLHASSITEGFLSKLGNRFLRSLYLGIAGNVDSRVWVARKDGAIVGFCAYSRNISAMYRSVLRARFARLAIASLPRSLNPLVLKEVFDTLAYPTKQRALDLPEAEILSIAVDAQGRGYGTGSKLLTEALKQAARDGAREIKVVVGAKLAVANVFYLALGFERRAEIVQHGGAVNVYVKATVEGDSSQ